MSYGESSVNDGKTRAPCSSRNSNNSLSWCRMLIRVEWHLSLFIFFLVISSYAYSGREIIEATASDEIAQIT